MNLLRSFFNHNSLIVYLLLIGIVFFTVALPHSSRAVSSHVVISEIQYGGIVANDEFVELYNSSTSPVDMNGWRLSRRISSLNGSLTNLVTTIQGTIQPHSYFLIANPSYSNGNVTPDLFYSATTSGIAANNSVILFSDNGQTIVDKVGMGTAEDAEGTSVALSETSQSIERKARSTSTQQTMLLGGVDEFLGNGFDSDNNQQDFLLRIVPQPQNSISTETVISTTPTQTPTEPPIPTNTPIPTQTPIPTPQPTLVTTPQPTLVPTPQPTPAPTLIPTTIPTIQPTLIPTAIPTQPPQPTPTPMVTPTLTPRPTTMPTMIIHFPNGRITCQITYKYMRIITKKIQIPILQCKVIRN